MVREPAVVLAHSPRGWAQELHFFLMDHGGAVVRGYVVSPDDALTERYDVLVVDDITSFLSPRFVASLQQKGSRVLGVYAADDAQGAGKQRLLELGVDEALPDTAAPTDFVDAFARLVGPVVADDPDLAGLLEELESRRTPGPPAPEPPEAVRRAGQVIAVAAAAGGTGATEISVALADAVRRQQLATVLVDADEQAPAVAQRLGLPLHPNIRTAVDTLQFGSGRLDDSLVRVPNLGIEVLPGLPNPRDWFELRAGEVTEVIMELARTRPRVLINVGPRIDDLPEMGGPARFAVSRGVIAMADIVVLVGSASPVGAARVVAWLAESRSLVGDTPVYIVLNQFPGGAFVAGELESEIRRNMTPAGLEFVPFDKRVTRAMWDGEPVPKGPFSKAVAKLADRLVVGAAR